MESDGNDFEESVENNVNYKQEYRLLKRKLKLLIYENEYFQESLRSTQRKFLKATRDRNFLLERLSAYEPPETTTTDTDETESSDDESFRTVKRKKIETGRSTTPPALQSAPKKPKKKARINKAAASSSPLVTVPNVSEDNLMLTDEMELQHLDRKKKSFSSSDDISASSEIFGSDLPSNRKIPKDFII